MTRSCATRHLNACTCECLVAKSHTPPSHWCPPDCPHVTLDCMQQTCMKILPKNCIPPCRYSCERIKCNLMRSTADRTPANDTPQNTPQLQLCIDLTSLSFLGSSSFAPVYTALSRCQIAHTQHITECATGLLPF
jgi:hypothetical protein